MLYIGADHGGYELKEHLKKYLKSKGIKVTDMGAKRLQSADDYVEYAAAVAKKISQNPAKDMGILLCRSGQGVCITANKFKHVRAALVWNAVQAKMSRVDDMANILCLPADYISPRAAEIVLKTWLNTSYSTEERHVRRIQKISALEGKK